MHNNRLAKMINLKPSKKFNLKTDSKKLNLI